MKFLKRRLWLWLLLSGIVTVVLTTGCSLPPHRESELPPAAADDDTKPLAKRAPTNSESDSETTIIKLVPLRESKLAKKVEVTHLLPNLPCQNRGTLTASSSGNRQDLEEVIEQVLIKLKNQAAKIKANYLILYATHAVPMERDDIIVAYYARGFFCFPVEKAATPNQF